MKSVAILAAVERWRGGKRCPLDAPRASGTSVTGAFEGWFRNPTEQPAVDTTTATASRK